MLTTNAKKLVWDPSSFLQISHLIFKLTFCFCELFSLKPSLFGPFYVFCSQYLWVLAMLRQRSYFAGTTAEHLQCPRFPSAPTLCCRWSPRLTNIYVSGQRFHRQNSYFAEPAKLGADQCHCNMWLWCGVTGMHCEQCSLKYRINVQIRFVCLFMSISTAFKFQTRPAMQQTIPAETAEDSRVAERFNYDQSTVLVWIYTAVLLQWSRPADWRSSAFARHRSQHRWVVHSGLLQQTWCWPAQL